MQPTTTTTHPSTTTTGRPTTTTTTTTPPAANLRIATGPGAGGGPHVRTFDAAGGPTSGFFAYDPAFTGGVSVAMGDVEGNGDDIGVAGAG